MTDNRTNEKITPEQVEAAANAFEEHLPLTSGALAGTGTYWCAECRKNIGPIDKARRHALSAALAAAAGAAPQAESSQARDLLALAKHLHRKYGRNQPTEWDMLGGALQTGRLIEAENTPMIAPVLPSSTVDEGDLAKVIHRAACGPECTDDAPMRMDYRIARAVVEAIGGEGCDATDEN